jgi:hypothetical protein
MNAINQSPTLRQLLTYFDSIHPNRDKSLANLPEWYDRDLSEIVELTAANFVIYDMSPGELADPVQLISDAKSSAEYESSTEYLKIFGDVDNHLRKINFTNPELPSKLEAYLSHIAENY